MWNRLFAFTKLGRSFGLVFSGQFLSQIGTGAHAIAITYYVKDQTASVFILGNVLFFLGLVSVVCSPIGGVLADMFNRRRIVFACDLTSAIVSLLLALWLLLLSPAFDSLTNVSVVATLSALLTLVSATMHPALGALLPDILPKEHLRAGNSIYRTGGKTADLLGTAFGGVVYRAIGPSLLFLVDAFSFLIAAILTLISTRNYPSSKEVSPRQEFGFFVVWRNFVEGARKIAEVPGAWTVIIMALAINAFATPIFLILPFHLDLITTGGSASYGIVLSCLYGGALAGYLLAAAVPLPAKGKAQILIAAVTVMCASFVFLALAKNLVLAMAAMVLAGIANGFWSIIFESGIQAAVPRAFLGRVFGIFGLLSSLLVPFANLLGGIAAHEGGFPSSYFIMAFAICATLVPICCAFSIKFREFFASI